MSNLITVINKAFYLYSYKQQYVSQIEDGGFALLLFISFQVE